MILENLKVSAKTGFHNYRINTLLLVVLNEKSPWGWGAAPRGLLTGRRSSGGRDLAPAIRKVPSFSSVCRGSRIPLFRLSTGQQRSPGSSKPRAPTSDRPNGIN